MIYAMYKPFDREMEMGIVDDEMPTWARSLFDKIEANKIISRLVGYKPKIANLGEREMLPALDPDELAESRQKFHQMLHERRNSNVGIYFHLKPSLIFLDLSPKRKSRTILAKKPS